MNNQSIPSYSLPLEFENVVDFHVLQNMVLDPGFGFRHQRAPMTIGSVDLEEIVVDQLLVHTASCTASWIWHRQGSLTDHVSMFAVFTVFPMCKAMRLPSSGECSEILGELFSLVPGSHSIFLSVNTSSTRSPFLPNACQLQSPQVPLP
jgi:hypothetical protein